MLSLQLKDQKFGSGLTYDEADALVEQYCAQYKDDPELLITVMKVHLKQAVRDHKHFRSVIGACLNN